MRIYRHAIAIIALAALTVAGCATIRQEGIDCRDNEGKTALIRAVISADIHCINAMLERGADPNVTDSNGMTPLMHAAIRGDHQSVTSLVSAGADSNVTDKYGKTAYTYAATCGNVHVIGALPRQTMK